MITANADKADLCSDDAVAVGFDLVHAYAPGQGARDGDRAVRGEDAPHVAVDVQRSTTWR